MGYFWGLGKVKKLFWGVLIWTTNFFFLKKARFGLYLTDQFSRGGLDGRADGQTESDYNATLWPPTDQLKLGLDQLTLSVGAECGNSRIMEGLIYKKNQVLVLHCMGLWYDQKVLRLCPNLGGCLT